MWHGLKEAEKIRWVHHGGHRRRRHLPSGNVGNHLWSSGISGVGKRAAAYDTSGVITPLAAAAEKAVGQPASSSVSGMNASGVVIPVWRRG